MIWQILIKLKELQILFILIFLNLQKIKKLLKNLNYHYQNLQEKMKNYFMMYKFHNQNIKLQNKKLVNLKFN